MTDVEQHLLKRKRGDGEPYPHYNQKFRFMDKGIFIIGLLGPILTIPQAYTIWVHKNADGVSLITWGFYVFYGIVWLFYGILHHEKPIITTYIGWLIVNTAVAVGTFLYR